MALKRRRSCRVPFAKIKGLLIAAPFPCLYFGLRRIANAILRALLWPHIGLADASHRNRLFHCVATEWLA
jgi:hypothetical protein